MLTLPLLLGLLLVHSSNGECAIGDASENTKWIGSEGRLKYPHYTDTQDLEYDEDESFIFESSCTDNMDYDVMDEFCNCTFSNTTGGIYSCYGEYMKSLPNLTRDLPVNELGIYSIRHAINVNRIKSYQFSGYKTKEIRIEYMENLHLEDRAFEGIFNLNTLKLTHNNFGKMGMPRRIFSGLVNLTILVLSYNEITGWETADVSEDAAPVLPRLETLDLSGNPLLHLHNDSFEWLQGSQLQNLILHQCDIKSIETGTLAPLQPTIKTIDVGNSYIPQTMILNLLKILASRCPLHGLALAKFGFTRVPYEILALTNTSLRYLSLHGNTIRTLGRDEIRRPKLPIQQAQTFQEDTKKLEKNVFPLMPKLEELDLSKCSIYYIQKNLFTTLPYLRALLLSDNQLISFKSMNSPGFSQLLYLDLSNNPLHVKTVNLTYFPALKTLDLSITKGGRLTKRAFTSLTTKLMKLSLCYSKLSYIEEGTFTNMSSLQVLDLTGNVNLGPSLTTGTFTGLTSLEELHLSECTYRALTRVATQENGTIEMDPFRELLTLKRINLSKNDITNINSEVLQELTQLESLDLSENYIRSWNDPVFLDTNLQNLNIRHNHLNYITNAMLMDFRKLKTLILSSNPFVCDCNCLEFLKMVKNVTINTQNPQPIEPRTLDSREDFVDLYIRNNLKIMETKSGFKAISSTDNSTDSFTQDWDVNEAYMCLDKLDSNEINYIPFENVPCDKQKIDIPVQPTASAGNIENKTGINKEMAIIIAVAVGLVVTTVIGIAYWKWWYIRYFAILVKNATILSFMSNDDDPSLGDRIFNYDTFISYSDQNREWVLSDLLPNLESNSNLKVCLHERDFQVGISILENIIASMDRSRCILLVISQSFLKSQWCQFELHLAQHRLLETRREELILLFLEDIPSGKRPKTLQYLMRTKTYILWPKKEDDIEGKKLFWKRLHHAILRNSAELDKKNVSMA